MGSEYFINSQELEDKVRNLLPSQGGAGAGFDLSASTQIIPIIDLTESAEGSNLRQDLQSSISHGSATVFNVSNTSSTVITNTGYWRIIGTSTISGASSTDRFTNIGINDGATTKLIWQHIQPSISTETSTSNNIDLIVFLTAGDSLILDVNTSNAFIAGSVRQIANIDGQLTNP